jgi:hypothetical protein
MYSHPHYLAFIREDGSTDPPDLPFGLQLGDVLGSALAIFTGVNSYP